jgi:hypothetical protein
MIRAGTAVAQALREIGAAIKAAQEDLQNQNANRAAPANNDAAAYSRQIHQDIVYG